MFKRLFVFTLIFSLGFISTQVQIHAQNQPKLILNKTSVGGLCTYGLCLSEFLIYDNGTGLFKVNSKEHPFTIDQNDLTKLQELINTTNFGQLRKIKFTKECPSAYDGSQNIYHFYTLNKEEKIDGCETLINGQEPLFSTIEEIIKKSNY